MTNIRPRLSIKWLILLIFLVVDDFLCRAYKNIARFLAKNVGIGLNIQ